MIVSLVRRNNALHLIQKYSSQINWQVSPGSLGKSAAAVHTQASSPWPCDAVCSQGMSPEAFNSFYRFVYFLCRGASKRHVQVRIAVLGMKVVAT
jgi:hypothetical protein